MVGGSRAKYCDVELVYKQVKVLRRMAHTMYTLPTALRERFQFDDIPEKPLCRHTNGTRGFVLQLHLWCYYETSVKHSEVDKKGIG